MRSLKAIATVILVSTIVVALVLALVLALPGGLALEYPPEAEMEETSDKGDWADARATHPTNGGASDSKRLSNRQPFAAPYFDFSHDHLHILLI
jgi:hypothetical protein